MFGQVLYLDATGLPIRWIGLEAAACQLVRDQVLWQLGDSLRVLRGGISRTGRRSTLGIPPVIAGRRAEGTKARMRPALTNANLFARDQYLCLYCGKRFRHRELTRDHVIPTSRWGANTFENCVAACRRCNNIKGARTPEEAGMSLLAVPFSPNPYESLLLQGRHICGDQMAYLRAGLSQRRDWMVA